MMFQTTDITNYTNIELERGLANSFIPDQDISDKWFTHSYMEDVLFLNCTLKKTSWGKANLENVIFENCQFLESGFYSAEFDSCDFYNCKFVSTSFNDASLEKTHF